MEEGVGGLYKRLSHVAGWGGGKVGGVHVLAATMMIEDGMIVGYNMPIRHRL